MAFPMLEKHFVTLLEVVLEFFLNKVPVAS